MFTAGKLENTNITVFVFGEKAGLTQIDGFFPDSSYS